jgi:hypothetical protein
MSKPRPTPTVDEAMAVFSTEMSARFGDGPEPQSSPLTPQEAEAKRFRFAETVLRAVCPDPTLCSHHHCKRSRLCRHFADLRAVENGTRKLPPSRRSPGATVIRHAIWLFVQRHLADG